MSQDSTRDVLLPSILNRLIDPDALGTSGRPWYGTEQLVSAVRRDVATLLNSRQTHQGLCDDYPQCARSLLAFGLPDPPSMEAHTSTQREAIARQIEHVVRQFEPRLSGVRISLLEPFDEREQAVHYLIEAQLQVGSGPDIAFEVILDLTTGRYDTETRRA